MSPKKHTNEQEAAQTVQLNDGEKERLLQDIHRSDLEKLRLFTAMLRKEALFKRAVVTHK
jgi:hypothetical protein